MHFKFKKRKLDSMLGWSGGDNIQSSIIKISELVKECVGYGRYMLRDGDGYVNPSTVLVSQDLKNKRSHMHKLMQLKTRKTYDQWGRLTGYICTAAYGYAHDSVQDLSTRSWEETLYGDISQGFKNAASVVFNSDFDCSNPDKLLELERELSMCYYKTLKDMRALAYEDYEEIKTSYNVLGVTNYDTSWYYHKPKQETPPPKPSRIVIDRTRNDWQDEEDEAIEDWWYNYEKQQEAYKDAEAEYWEKKSEEEYRRKNTFVPLDDWKNDPYKRSHSYEYNRDWWNKNVEDDG